MFTEYEKHVIDEMARHIAKPNTVHQLLSLAGKPVVYLLKKAEEVPVLSKIPALVNKGVKKGVSLSLKASEKLYSDEAVLAEFQKVSSIKSLDEINLLKLEQLDAVADRFKGSNTALLGLEGFLAGTAISLGEVIPLAALAIPAVVASDVAASMTFLSRHASQIATVYGYSPRDPKNLPHWLEAMVPHTQTSDEGYLSAKGTALYEIRAASQFLTKYSGQKANDILMKAESPLLVRLMNSLVTRLQIALTEKQLAALMPVAGGVLNGAVNVLFQKSAHVTAKDYFRKLYLTEKYGEEAVEQALSAAISKLG